MKRKAFRFLSIFLVVLTLAGTLSIPAFAYSYPMDYTITYKTTDGKTLGTKTGQVDAAADVRNSLSSGAPSSQTKTEDVTLTISTTKPTRSGYTFLGWSTSSTASSASYQPGGSYSANASVTLYAVWSCNHSATKKVWDTGCDWRTVCHNCGTTISSGATHGPYTFSDWQYYSASQHKRTKECDYGDYSTIEYATHSTTTRYDQYSSSQHKKYSYCDTCSSTVGSVVYESHSFTTTTSNGQVISTCSQCGYTKTTAQTYTVRFHA